LDLSAIISEAEEGDEEDVSIQVGTVRTTRPTRVDSVDPTDENRVLGRANERSSTF
jgi:hypothetical protein